MIGVEVMYGGKIWLSVFPDDYVEHPNQRVTLKRSIGAKNKRKYRKMVATPAECMVIREFPEFSEVFETMKNGKDEKQG